MFWNYQKQQIRKLIQPLKRLIKTSVMKFYKYLYFCALFIGQTF